MGVLAGFLILSFYGVVGGWTLAYIVKSLGSNIAHFETPEKAGEFFGTLYCRELFGNCGLPPSHL